MKSTITLTFTLFIAVNISCKAQEIKFEKTNIDPTYVSAGITAADIDKDGLKDIVAGDVWYKAPNWERHDIRPLGPYYGTLVDPTKPRGSGASYYARSIGNYTKDIDGDGWLDVITFNSQGAPCYWYRNPQGKFDQLWQEYLAIELFHNESPQMVDLFGDGELVVLAGNHIGDNKFTLSWFSIPEDPTQLWTPHVIGHPDDFDLKTSYGTTQYYAPAGRGHGLGVGDIDGDGINDVLTGKGWYKGSKDGKTKENWAFNPIPFDEMADPERRNLIFAQLFVSDFDSDGDNDMIGGASHGYGLWWFEQIKKDGKIDFIKHDIRMDLSQLHAMNAVDLNGDGIKEYVTGKRYLAHLGRDPGSSDPATIAYVSQNGTGNMETYIIDDNSGSGTQIWATDMNNDGKPDLVTSNKKGTSIFIQE